MNNLNEKIGELYYSPENDLLLEVVDMIPGCRLVPLFRVVSSGHWYGSDGFWILARERFALEPVLTVSK